MAFRNHQKGFTIIELMIAMGVFAVTIVLVTSGVIVIGRQYRQAVTQTRLQSATREIHQYLIESVQFAGSVPIFSGESNGWKSFCSGTKRYTYAAYSSNIENPTMYDNLKPGLYIDDVSVGNCSVPAGNITELQNLLPDGAKVVMLSYDNSNFTTKFVSSDSDLLNYPGLTCKGAVAGKEFCAVVQLNSTAIKRVSG